MTARQIKTSKTNSVRQTNYLATLKNNNGRRVPVDLDASRLSKIAELQHHGYGASIADVIRKAVDEIYIEKGSKINE